MMFGKKRMIGAKDMTGFAQSLGIIIYGTGATPHSDFVWSIFLSFENIPFVRLKLSIHSRSS